MTLVGSTGHYGRRLTPRSSASATRHGARSRRCTHSVSTTSRCSPCGTSPRWPRRSPPSCSTTWSAVTTIPVAPWSRRPPGRCRPAALPGQVRHRGQLRAAGHRRAADVRLDAELAAFAPGHPVRRRLLRPGHGLRVGPPHHLRRAHADASATGSPTTRVDHSPAYLWNSATWGISEALIPYLRTVMSGPGGVGPGPDHQAGHRDPRRRRAEPQDPLVPARAPRPPASAALTARQTAAARVVTEPAEASVVARTPRWLARGEHELPDDLSWLAPGEIRRAGGMRFAKRRTEYLLRRWVGKQAVAAVTGASTDLPALSRIEVANRMSGAPYVLVDGRPVGLDVSLTDRAGGPSASSGTTSAGSGATSSSSSHGPTASPRTTSPRPSRASSPRDLRESRATRR